MLKELNYYQYMLKIMISNNSQFHPIYTFGFITESKHNDETSVDRIYECKGYVKYL